VARGTKESILNKPGVSWRRLERARFQVIDKVGGCIVLWGIPCVTKRRLSAVVA
jgi:hypothetical protein